MENGSNHETRISALEQARKNIEDSFLVMSQLEARQSHAIKALAEDGESQQKQIAEQRKMNAETDARIAKLASAIGELISRMPPPRG